MKQKRKETDYILPVLAIVLSLGSLTSTYDLTNIPSLIISLVGISAGILFFLNHKLFATFMQIWIYGQLPAISKTVQTTLENGMQLIIEHPYFDTGQLLTFDLGLTLGTSSGDLDLKINIVPFGLLFLFKLLQTAGLIGKDLTVTKFRKENKLGNVFPLTAKIQKRVQIGKERHWILAALENEFSYGGKSISHLLLKPKDEELFKAGKKKYISYVRLVSDPDTVGEVVNNIDNYPFVDWGVVEIKK
jgi:hypothetical protein